MSMSDASNQHPLPWASTSADEVNAKKYRFLNEFRRHSEQLWDKPSIYRVPTRTRELNPKAYEPRVISIGPYHHGKDHLELMEHHKHRALCRFLTRIVSPGLEDLVSQGLEDLVSHFKEGRFLRHLMECYASSLDVEWMDEQTFSYLMVLDGCFVFELLLTADRTSPGYANNDPIFGVAAERHGVVQYIKMDMLLLENQLPLLVLNKLANIAQKELNINDLIQKFYGLPSSQTLPSTDPLALGLHVLDVYRKARLLCGTYDGWTLPNSVQNLDNLGINLMKRGSQNLDNFGINLMERGSATPPCCFSDIAFRKHEERSVMGTLYDHFLNPLLRSRWTQSAASRLGSCIPVSSLFSRWTTEWLLSATIVFWVHKALNFFFLVIMFWFPPIWVVTGDLDLPVLLINEVTEALLLNLMAFERLHLRRDRRGMAVTCYVFLMSSLIRSKEDVALLRKKGVVVCLPERKDKEVVQMIQGITRDVLVETGKGVLKEVGELCERKPNKLQAKWRRRCSSDLKGWVMALLAIYGLCFTMIQTLYVMQNYELQASRPQGPCRS